MHKIICKINMDADIFWMYCAEHKSFNHNNYGPASEFASGTKLWAVSGKLHRLDGPAVEYASGRKNWYINDINYNTEFEYWVAVQNYNNAHG